MTDTLIETPELRVRITQDLDPRPPEWDGSAFVLRLEHSVRTLVDVVRADYGQEVPEGIVELIREHAGDLEAVRELLLAEGVLSFDYWATGYSTYVAFTTKDLAKSWGLRLDFKPDQAFAAESAKQAITVWRRWSDGEQCGYVLEERATWARAPVDRDSQTIETWEEVDACHGFYSLETAEEAGKAAFAAEAVRRALVVSA